MTFIRALHNVFITAKKNIPILDTEKDRIPWSEYIFTLADEHGVKGYINPDVASPRLPTQPIRPSPTIIWPTTVIPATQPDQGNSTRPTLFSDLTADEREQLRWLSTEYDDDKRIFRNILKL